MTPIKSQILQDTFWDPLNSRFMRSDIEMFPFEMLIEVALCLGNR